MVALFSLVLVLLLLLHGGGTLEQDPRECTQRDSGSNQVMYFLQTAYTGTSTPNAHTMAYCTLFDDNLFGRACTLMRSFMVTTQSPDRNIIMNMDLAVLKERNHRDHEIDMHRLGFPISYWNLGSSDTTDIEFHLFRSKVKKDKVNDNNVCGFYRRGCRLRDNRKLCAPSQTCLIPRSDPLGLGYLDMALYVNEYHATKAYFFVKKDSNVAVYPIEYSELFDGQDVYVYAVNGELDFAAVEKNFILSKISLSNIIMITFLHLIHILDVLLFCSGKVIDQNIVTEVHYYAFDEQRPDAQVQLVEKLVLHGFDFFEMFDATNGYLDNIMTFPVFKSFGRQVFIGLRKLSGAATGQKAKSHQQQEQQSFEEGEWERYRIWTSNPSEGRESDNVRVPLSIHYSFNAERRTFVIDGRFIRTEQAKLPRPPKASSKKATTTRTTTGAMSTTNSAASSSSSFVPGITSTLSVPGTTSLASTTVSTTAAELTTTEEDVGVPVNYEDGNEAHGKDGQNGGGAEGGFWCGPIHRSWWGLTLFIFLDLVLIIVIVLLIICVLVGRHKEQIYGKQQQKKSLKKGDGRKKKPASKRDTTSGKVTAETEGEKDGGELAGKKKESNKDGKEGVARVAAHGTKKTKKTSTKGKKMNKK